MVANKAPATNIHEEVTDQSCGAVNNRHPPPRRRGPNLTLKSDERRFATLRRYVVIKIPPIRIQFLNQIDFPIAIPFLDLKLSRSSRDDGFMHFVPNKTAKT